MRILRLEATNVKKLKAVAISPDGNVVRIAGANGSGKTSVLDSIYWAIAGKKAISSKPVRSGEESATIVLSLGKVTVKRRFKPDGETAITVESADGARYPSPQKLLDDLFGALTFDPLAFTRAEPKKQLETLKGLVKIDLDFDALARENERDYQFRSDWNRKVKSLTERVATLSAGVDESIDVTPIDVGDVAKAFHEATEHNAGIERTIAKRRERQARMNMVRQNIESIEADLARLTAKRNAAQELLAQLEIDAAADTVLPHPIDVSALHEQIANADRENKAREAQARQRDLHASAVAELEEATAKSDELTKAMEARTARKVAAIADAKMPVDGLGFGEGEVLYNGLPFDQASTAEQIRVSFAIAIAMNPKLRVVLIRDGSLLDEKSLALIEQMANDNDMQVWIEQVSGGPVGIYLEDGMVTAIDGVPVESEHEEALTSAAATVGA